MFQEEYKKAYNRISPTQKIQEKVQQMAKEEIKKQEIRKQKIGRQEIGKQKDNYFFHKIFGKPIIVALMICFGLGIVIPVSAAQIPVIYAIIENISPKLADLLVPVEKSCTDKGICMQVEAIQIEGNQAKIYLSFFDQEGKDRIGKNMDLFGSYGLLSRDGKSNIAGCSFLTYQEENKKAYFQVSVQAQDAFEKKKLTFYVSELLGKLTKNEQEIDLSNTVYQAETKNVAINGASGKEDIAKYAQKLKGERKEGDPRPVFRVLKTNSIDKCKEDDFTIVQIAYVDEILRVQICKGDTRHAVRNAELFLTDKAGQQYENGYSVSWHEDTEDGKQYSYQEYWFFGISESLEQYKMYGIFQDSEESIQGNWKVDFRLETE